MTITKTGHINEVFKDIITPIVNKHRNNYNY